MNKIITLLFLLISFSSRAQPGCDYPRPNRDELLKGGVCVLVQPPIPQKKDSTKPTQISLRCGGTTRDWNGLLIVDGKVKAFKDLKCINPDDIKSISILSSTKAMAIYGSQGAMGAIVVDLKKTESRTFLIKDEIDGRPIPGATIMFVSFNREDTIMLSAGIDGSVNADQLKPKKNYEVIVSAVAYHSVRQPLGRLTDSIDIIRLPRNIIECNPVIVTTLEFRTIRCYCPSSIKRIKEEKTTVLNSPLNFSTIRLFPNPVAGGTEITIESAGKEIQYLQVKDLLGRVLLNKKIEMEKTGKLKLALDPRWAPGNYFIQVFYENGLVSASGKIIIQ